MPTPDPARGTRRAVPPRRRPLVDHLSEAALNRSRVHVEVEWLIHLTTQGTVPGVRALTADEIVALRRVVADFGPADVAELAAIERETVHDVKAVEYYLKRRLARICPEPADAGLAEMVHFACTSEDVNNLSYAVMVRGAVREVWLPAATALTDQIAGLAKSLGDIPMLARTHGQPATPTTLGKELAVLAWRLRRQLDKVAGRHTSASSTARPAPTARTLPRCRGRTGRRCRGPSSSTSG